MAYIGAVEVSVSSTRTNTLWNKTIKAPTTTVSGLDDRSNRLTLPQSYNKYAVYYNGVRLSYLTDYTHNQNILTFPQTLNEGDVISVEFFTASEINSSTEPLPTTGGIASGNIEAPEFIRINQSQPENHQLLSRKNSPYIGENSIIRTNASTIKENLTIPADINGMSAGPITIEDGITITLSGSWTVI